jgi:hypothetical protein
MRKINSSMLGGKDNSSKKTSYAEMNKIFAALLRVILNLGENDNSSIKTSYEDR